MFLTAKQIYDLTDKKQPAAQIRWLVANGYPFEVGVSGQPKVLTAYVESQLMGDTSTRHSGVDLEALARAG